MVHPRGNVLKKDLTIKFNMMIEFENYNITESEISERIHKSLNDTNDTEDSKEILKFALSIIDLTTLEGSDTNDKVAKMCEKAVSFSKLGLGLDDVAAVCVYPPFVKIAGKLLKNSDVKVASVAGGFPAGQTPLFIKRDEVKYVADEGADEIDIVISRGKLIQGDYDEVMDELVVLREAAKDTHLKVILETGELHSIYNIRKASEIAINSSADFIKTSTGKIQPAATERAVLIMLDTIKEYYEKTEKKIGIKAAGGIADKSQVFRYYCLVKSVLGDEWLTKDLFRIGASRLAGHITEQF